MSYWLQGVGLAVFPVVVVSGMYSVCNMCLGMGACVCVCACVCIHLCVLCMCACVHACICACEHASVRASMQGLIFMCNK